MPTNTAGLNTYQAAQSALTGSLLSLYGTQNASIPGSEALNPSQGKTPAAIEMYSNVEATRDGAERRHLETAIEQLTDGFFSLVANVGTEDIPVSLFADDIQDIVDAGLADVMGLFNGNLKQDTTGTAADLTIKPGSLKGVEYRFNIKPDSTAKTNKAEQLAAVTNLLGDLGKFQNIYKDDPRVDVNFGEILRRIGELSDIKGAEKFITIKDGPSPQEQQMQQKMQELQSQQQQAQQTQVSAPTGQVHEAADLTKLYLGTTDESLKAQIVEALGFTPGPPQPQPIANAAGVFNDPHVAAAAEHIHNLATNSPEPNQPTVNQAGAYHDPTVASAAEMISKMSQTKMPQGEQSAVQETGA